MSGTVHFKKDRRQWVVAWSWQGKRYQISRYKGRLMQQTHPDKRKDQGYIDAERLRSQMQGDVENGVFRLEKYTGNRYTDVLPFFEVWLETKRHKKPATQALYRNFFKCHIKPFFEENPIQLHEIQLDTLDKLRASLKMGEWSSYLCMQTFKGFLDYAWRSKKIPEVPPFPKRGEYQIEQKPIKWISTERQMRIIAAIPEEHQPIFLFLKYHLRRPAEAMALHKSDYNLFNRSFCIHRSISAAQVVDSTKTGAVHWVPCHSAMLPVIERLLKANDSPFLFVNRLSRSPGKRYCHKALARIWRNACENVGESIDLYSGLKHSSMSQYINERGLMLAELQAISGHAKMESVKRYADVGLDRIRALMESEPEREEKRLRKVK